MSVSKLMSDPKAARIYASLDAHIPPATLADDHLRAKLAGNAPLALALECFMRDLARIYFHVDAVRAALAKIERNVGMRKLGTSAPRMLKDIAAKIERFYASGCYDTNANGTICFMINTGSGTLRVTCEDMPGAVALVCAKYRRGLPKRR